MRDARSIGLKTFFFWELLMQFQIIAKTTSCNNTVCGAFFGTVFYVLGRVIAVIFKVSTSGNGNSARNK